MTNDARAAVFVAMTVLVSCEAREPIPLSSDSTPSEAAPPLDPPPAFGPDTFPAFVSLASRRQIDLLLSHRQRSCSPRSVCVPEIVIRPVMSLPKGEGRALGEILVLAVMDDGWPGGRWFAYFRDASSASLQPFEVDLYVGPGEGVTYFHYPFRRLSGDWAELAEGPWGSAGWIERPSVRELDDVLPLRWGSSIELEGAYWMVIEAGADHVVLRPEPEDRCSGEVLEPVQDSLLRTLTRADLTDERGHYRFRYLVVVC